MKRTTGFFCALLLATVAVATCKSDDVFGPDDIFGTYRLVSIAGDTVPAPFRTPEAGWVMAGTIELRRVGSAGGGSVADRESWRPPGGVPEDIVLPGQFEVDRDSVWLHVGDPYLCGGTYSRSRIVCEMTVTGHEWVWERTQ